MDGKKKIKSLLPIPRGVTLEHEQLSSKAPRGRSAEYNGEDAQWKKWMQNDTKIMRLIRLLETIIQGKKRQGFE